MKAKIFSLLTVSLIAGSVFSQSPDKTKLDALLNGLEANNKFMGSVSVSKNGKTIYSRAIGCTDAATGKKLNENSKFRIGSISKTFTAALVLKAVEEKKIKLTDNIESYFPTVPNASKITISNLLNHRSGIHNFTDDPDYTSWMTIPKTEKEMVTIISQAASEFEPESKGEYSNSNYVLLSYILEKAYKKPYKEIVDQNIIKPLSLKNTYFGGKINPANNEAYSYSYNKKWEKEPETDTSIPMGAGAMVSTPNDLSRFLEALFAGKVISAASFDQMKTIKDGYGMGLFEYPYDGKMGYGHSGGIDGFTSMLAHYPADNITFALTCNSGGAKNNVVALALLNWANGKPFEVPDFTTVNYTSEELDKYTGNYTSKDIPLAIVISKDGTSLVGQATGQGAFPLEAEGRNNFRFDAAGIAIEFKPEEKQMKLKQGGAVYNFTKE